jgi:hypothetical protein
MSTTEIIKCIKRTGQYTIVDGYYVQDGRIFIPEIGFIDYYKYLENKNKK